MICNKIRNIFHNIPPGEQTRCCGPGDIVTISGVFLSERLTGYRAIKAGLQSNVYVESLLIEKQKLGYNDVHNDKAAELAVRYDKRKKNEIQNKIIIFHIYYIFFFRLKSNRRFIKSECLLLPMVFLLKIGNSKTITKIYLYLQFI